MIQVIPTKIVYYHNNKGISNAHWEAEQLLSLPALGIQLVY